MKINYTAALLCLAITPVMAPAQSSAAMPDIVINEILFNPRPAGVDYIEICNRSDHSIDLNGWWLANRSAAGALGSLKKIATGPQMIGAGGYKVITEDTAAVQDQYYVKDAGAFIRLSSLPSFPDAGGTVVLLNAQSVVEDEVPYSEKWHFKLIDNPEGVALERISYNKPSGDPDNWQSAAASAGYGTPSYRNSQYSENEIVSGSISIEPRVFSPDNDGHDDYAIINYRFGEPGYVCNITLFNIKGVPVRYPARNAICGTQGYFKWDGLDENGKTLSAGNYILFAEVFNLRGKTMRYKQVVTLARRLH